jgi:DNA polymerase III subunit chi
MGEVGFYHLTRSTLDEALPALLEKAVERGLRLVLVARSQEVLDHLDRWLWTYRPDSFLPHGTAAGGLAARQPVLLSAEPINPNGATVLVTVDGLVPAADAPFERVLDLFDGRDEAAVAAARERWRTWRTRPARLVYWQQRLEGGWAKAREEGASDLSG